jgi:hypothetical protein
MRLINGLATLCLIAAASLPPTTFAEAAPPRVQAYSCSALSAQIGPQKVWQTAFVGYRPSTFDFFREHPGKDRYAAAPCFKTQSACNAWLHWIQTDWPDNNNHRPCRRGLRY